MSVSRIQSVLFEAFQFILCVFFFTNFSQTHAFQSFWHTWKLSRIDEFVCSILYAADIDSAIAPDNKIQ